NSDRTSETMPASAAITSTAMSASMAAPCWRRCGLTRLVRGTANLDLAIADDVADLSGAPVEGLAGFQSDARAPDLADGDRHAAVARGRDAAAIVGRLAVQPDGRGTAG